MKNVYICTTCGEIIIPEYFADGKPACPEGDHHDVFPLIQACDMINAYLYELKQEETDMWRWDEN